MSNGEVENLATAISSGDPADAVTTEGSSSEQIVSRHFYTALVKRGKHTSPEDFQRECEALEARDRRVRFVFDGLVFVYPFICLCCGVQIEAEQWAYGRACGVCDCGHCKHPMFDTMSKEERDRIRPHVMRFVDGEIVQIDLSDMMRLRRAGGMWPL